MFGWIHWTTIWGNLGWSRYKFAQIYAKLPSLFSQLTPFQGAVVLSSVKSFSTSSSGGRAYCMGLGVQRYLDDGFWTNPFWEIRNLFPKVPGKSLKTTTFFHDRPKKSQKKKTQVKKIFKIQSLNVMAKYHIGQTLWDAFFWWAKEPRVEYSSHCVHLPAVFWRSSGAQGDMIGCFACWKW